MLREEIVKALRERGPMTSTELMEYLMAQGVEVKPLEFREVLAEMVRKGEVEKFPVYEEKKFKFRLPQRA